MTKKIFLNINNFVQPLKTLPTPSNISIIWNFGSLLGTIIIIQLISGILLIINYNPSALLAFKSISEIIQNVNIGWFIRFTHSNGARFFILFIYFHIGRNIYFNNFKNKITGITGLIILLLSILTAFIGYVLPWGQMSFWGATVITRLITAIPVIGNSLVVWVWGNFSISSVTLNRFFSFHIIFPLVLLVIIFIHIQYLHNKGSLSPLTNLNKIEKIFFHPYFTYKDLITLILIILSLIFISIWNPYLLIDPENFTIANPIITPVHIQPEWYFLLSYAILRCIPNKLGGVIALIISILLLILPILKSTKIFSSPFSPLKKFLFWILLNTILLLTWIGANSISDPIIFIAQIFSLIYFFIIIII